MTTDIFIRTYAKDAEWLRYCLRSIQKFCTGFRDLVVVCPEESAEAIRPLALEFLARFEICPRMHANDYVGQQATKMMADTWCRSDIICFMDSDTIFIKPFCPDNIAHNGRVRLLKTPYTEVETPWQELTARIVGFPVEFEYMRRHPLSYPTEFLPFARRHISETQGKSFEEFIRDIPGGRLSEFNALGAIADKLKPEMIEWLDTTGIELPELFVLQHWSHGGLTPEIKEQMEGILKMRAPTKADFVEAWGAAGYRENFEVYSAQSGIPEQQIVDACLRPYFNSKHVALEIGCGGGYWPEFYLCSNFKHVTGLDVLPGDPFMAPNFTYIEVPDRDYSCWNVPDESIDFVWSFGVFCHLNLESIQQYLRSVHRVLKPGGRAVLYFSNDARRPGMVTYGGGIDGVVWECNDLETSMAMLRNAGFDNPVDLMPQLYDTMLGVQKSS